MTQRRGDTIRHGSKRGSFVLTAMQTGFFAAIFTRIYAGNNLAISDDALTYAWLRVKENGGGAGADGVGLERFGDDLLLRLAKLRGQVKSGNYVPDPLLRIELARPGLLAVPTVRDRVLQTAVAQVINPILDPTFEEESFAYRPGRSVRDAISAIIDARDDGFTWVVDADIEAFFDNIPHDELLEKLTAVLPDESVQPLVKAWLKSPVKTASGFHPTPAKLLDCRLTSV